MIGCLGKGGGIGRGGTGGLTEVGPSWYLFDDADDSCGCGLPGSESIAGGWCSQYPSVGEGFVVFLGITVFSAKCWAVCCCCRSTSSVKENPCCTSRAIPRTEFSCSD